MFNCFHGIQCSDQDFWGRLPITDTDLFKATFLSCRIIYSDDPIQIFWHLFRAWISFLKMNSPLRWLLWEGIFFYSRGGGGHFLDIFQKYVFISPKCLIMHCIFLTIVQLLHNSLHTAQAWFHELYVKRTFTPGSHILHLQSVCLVRKRCRSSTDCAFTQESAPNPWLFTTNTFIHYFDLQSKHCHWKRFFSICDSFLHSTVIQSFIDVFKRNKYKKHIIQCFLLLHLLLEVAQASGKIFKTTFFTLSQTF